MNIRTQALTGPALDWAVAKAEGLLEPRFGEKQPRVVVCDNTYIDQWVVRLNPKPHTYYEPEYNPSTNWAQGGPIIEREGVVLDFHGDHWTALMWWDDEKSAAEITMRGPTPLIAAMRCYVASQLGDEVDVPEALHG